MILQGKRIISKGNRPLIMSPDAVRCPLCNEEQKDGIQLKRHVIKIHTQTFKTTE